jgi:hypothetical protein
MRTIRIKLYKFNELSESAKQAAIIGLNENYSHLVNCLRYAKEFTPHKVGYYEERLSEIITRKSIMPDSYEFTQDGKLS